MKLLLSTLPISHRIPSRNEFPAQHLITLYYRAAQATVYVNQMEGFKLLYDWLASDGVTITPGYNQHNLPEAFGSYETQEISGILRIPESLTLSIILDIHNDNWIPRQRPALPRYRAAANSAA
jgi:hypothetical protein